MNFLIGLSPNGRCYPAAAGTILLTHSRSAPNCHLLGKQFARTGFFSSSSRQINHPLCLTILECPSFCHECLSMLSRIEKEMSHCGLAPLFSSLPACFGHVFLMGDQIWLRLSGFCCLTGGSNPLQEIDSSLRL